MWRICAGFDLPFMTVPLSATWFEGRVFFGVCLLLAANFFFFIMSQCKILQPLVQAAINQNSLSGNIRRAFAREPYDRVGHFARFSQTLKRRIRRPTFEDFFFTLAASGACLRQLLQPIGRGETRAHIVDENAV